MIFAGFHQTMEYGSTSLVTVAFAQIIAQFQILIPGKIVAL